MIYADFFYMTVFGRSFLGEGVFLLLCATRKTHFVAD